MDKQMKEAIKKRPAPYTPKTCPFCHFYGIRKNKNNWSCDMCGRVWTKDNDPRLKE